MKKPPTEAGLKDMMSTFGAPTTPQTGQSYGISMWDDAKSRGPLAFVPRDGIARVIPADTGRVSTSGLGLSSAARADYTCGRLWKTPGTADHRVMPETQLPGSLNANTAGLGLNVERGGPLRQDMARPAVDA